MFPDGAAPWRCARIRLTQSGFSAGGGCLHPADKARRAEIAPNRREKPVSGKAAMDARMARACSAPRIRKPRMTKFSDLKLDAKVLKAVTEVGYETPTLIQAGAIPPALEGRDVLGIAQTGTGKHRASHCR